MIFDKYPYTNFHEMNDDWIIQTMRLFDEKLDEFVAMNSLTYADPIAYDPDAIYPANTVVIYENTAYVSKQAIPAGMLPTTGGEYWLMIFPFGDLIQQGVDAGIAQIDAYLAQADEQITAALNAIPLNVTDWLNQHPEVTTSVEDRSLTYAKLHNSLCDILLANYTAGEMTAIANTDFGQGSINPTTGAKITGTANSCLSNGYLIGRDEIIVLRAPVDFVIAVYEYTDNATVYVGVTLAAVNENWSAFYAKAGHSYRFTVMAADQSAITPGSLPAVVVAYSAYSSSIPVKAGVANEYSDTETYALNDYVIHDNVMYRCTVPILTPESWTNTHWTAVGVAMDEVNVVDRKVDNLIDTEVDFILANGTATNTGNTNAVCSQNYIPCAYGDVVSVQPVRPNTSGYIYKYGYTIYDASKAAIKNVQTADASNICVINLTNAAYIRFFIVEMSGNTYNALRAASYGYTPYAVIEKADSIDDPVIDANIRKIVDSWRLGGLDGGNETTNSRRLICDYVRISNASKVTIALSSGYSFAVNYYDARKNWITADSAWRTARVDCTGSDFGNGVEYIRLCIKANDNHILTLADAANIHFAVTTDLFALNAAEDVSDAEEARYRDLLYQARFSPTSNAKVLTLMHFSDVHADLDSMKTALAIDDKYGTFIDDMIHTGDVVLANFSDGIVNWVNSGCAQRVISVIGNHDSENNLSLGTAGKENVYNALLAPYIGNWGVVQPTGVNDPNSDYYCACYYYKDYSAASMRLIVLDTNWWDTYEKTWLGTVLTDAKTRGYAVILACHTPRFVTGITAANFCSYTEPVISESSAYTNIPNDWLDPVNTFISGGGELVCMLSGHNHRDHIGYLTNYPNVLCITADKSSIARTIDTARIRNEINANAYNIVTFNTTDKLIKIVRMGAEVDGRMRGKHVFCYDYANRQIIAQW